jgi:hypothetical protein
MPVAEELEEVALIPSYNGRDLSAQRVDFMRLALLAAAKSLLRVLTLDRNSGRFSVSVIA